MKEAEKQGFEFKMDAAFVKSVFEENQRLREEVVRLNANLAWFMRQMFGRKSEKLARLDPNQLGLDFEGFGLKLPEQGQTGEAVQATIEELPVPATKKKAARPRKDVMEGLPVVEVVIEPDNLDRNRYVRIGEEHTKTLEFDRASYTSRTASVPGMRLKTRWNCRRKEKKRLQ